MNRFLLYKLVPLLCLFGLLPEYALSQCVRDVLQGIAMDDDHRGIHAALVRVTRLGTEHARALGRLKLHRQRLQPSLEGK